VRAKIGIPIACFCALSVFLCAELGLKAQSPPTASQPGAAPVQDSTNEVAVAVGKTLLIDCAQPIKTVAIGAPEIAEASAISLTEILVNGKAPGETSLILWDKRGGRQFFNITVRPSSAASTDTMDAIRRELAMELPGQALKVTSENNIVFLRGTVKNLNSSTRAVQIASSGGGKVVNLLNVDVPDADPQILLKVRFASVDRSKERQLGINLLSSGFGNTIAGTTTGQFNPPSVGLAAAGAVATPSIPALNLFAFFPGLNLGANIEALEQKGVVEVLAEPNVMAVNGKEASFLAGGEFPFPVAQAGSGGGAATISIEFKEFGIRLNFIPTITPRGTIRLQVAPEVSALDFTNAIEIAGFDVPALTERKVKTEVELSDGQSFVVGGLLDKNENEAFQKIPFLGDIPIIGKFFQSMQRTKTDTELVIIVTPELVSPIAAGSALPELKFPEKFLPSNSGIPMNNPDAKTAANTPATPPASIPVEKLIESMRPEAPLVIEGVSGGFGSGGGGISTAAPVAPGSAPQ
jgi:pilus assembly protein CpaC